MAYHTPYHFDYDTKKIFLKATEVDFAHLQNTVQCTSQNDFSFFLFGVLDPTHFIVELLLLLLLLLLCHVSGLYIFYP